MEPIPRLQYLVKNVVHGIKKYIPSPFKNTLPEVLMVAEFRCRAPKYPYQKEYMIIDCLLDYSDPLKLAYNCLHDMMDTFRHKDPNLFIHLLKELPKNLDSEFP